MNAVVQVIIFLSGLVLFLLAILFLIPSFYRHETQAGIFGLVGAVIGAFLLAAALLPLPGKSVLAGALVCLAFAFGILFILPIGSFHRKDERPTMQVDERTIMFSRRRLMPCTPRYENYYRDHPEQKNIDDSIRALPGLLSLSSPMADPWAFAATQAGFFLTESLRDAVDGPTVTAPQEIAPEVVSQYLKHLAQYFGAGKVGITEVRDYHIYSHVGRGSGEYGEPVVLNHPYAIVFTFEMAEEMVHTAPKAPEMMETALQYSEAAQTAIQIAAWIRELGYKARAHIDGNYRLILPLVGRDAGLGEIGRMGLLMTPDLGPRIRLSAVSTTMPLTCDPPGDNSAVLDFCHICKKCAVNCPGQAIPLDDRQEIEGALRWKINSEKCFHYWNTVGTDCARCMMVCPYSHPNDPAHNLVRWMIARSGAARRIALQFDDLVYGRKPKSLTGPKWTQMKMQ